MESFARDVRVVTIATKSAPGLASSSAHPETVALDRHMSTLKPSAACPRTQGSKHLVSLSPSVELTQQAAIRSSWPKISASIDRVIVSYGPSRPSTTFLEQVVGQDLREMKEICHVCRTRQHGWPSCLIIRKDSQELGKSHSEESMGARSHAMIADGAPWLRVGSRLHHTVFCRICHRGAPRRPGGNRRPCFSRCESHRRSSRTRHRAAASMSA